MHSIKINRNIVLIPSSAGYDIKAIAVRSENNSRECECRPSTLQDRVSRVVQRRGMAVVSSLYFVGSR